jgi:phosphoribosylglycinamide formyltransferase 2
MTAASVTLGTATTRSKFVMLLLGSGELGKEVAIEAQRLGVHVVAADRYPNAPAMQVAHESRVLPMTDGAALRALLDEVKPDVVVPEIEAIATDVLVAWESEGHRVVPTARAAKLTMNREGIRRLAAEDLGLRTSPFVFADTEAELRTAAETLGFPLLVKPIMSSSGKGQSLVKTPDDLGKAWSYAQEGGRAGGGRVIVEGFVDFDFEITLLTVRHAGGTSFCPAIGHRQVKGDYHESWQPQPMTPAAQAEAERIAMAVTGALGGQGLFGVELFVKGDVVTFSEVSPRPHDTGMVTLISQELSEFALHVRAIVGLPVPSIETFGPSASWVLLATGTSNAPAFRIAPEALAAPRTSLRLFGKPEIAGSRRLGVALARGATIDEARAKARAVIDGVVPLFDGVPGERA